MFKDQTRIKENSIDFPHTTINHMIDIVRKNQYNDELLGKLRHIEFLETTDINKANRWFGYYQRVGEELGYWTLDDVIKWVREEKEEKKKEV